MDKPHYTGRFAPSPTGPLHIGSLVAALASYLDAKVHGGAWLVRIEDVDGPRNVPGADRAILASLLRCGMQWDGDVVWQSARAARYEAALARLGAAAYPCACSRKEIVDSQSARAPDGALVYPGTCRTGLAPGRAARAWRLNVGLALPAETGFVDRWHGPLHQNVQAAVGDFVLKRADGCWAYQLAVVVDDAEQGVTDVVRGADLLDSTPRQMLLQHALGLPSPTYLHVPVVTNDEGDKLSKQTGAQAFDSGTSSARLLQQALLPAARFLGMHFQADELTQFWRHAVPMWEHVLRARTEVGGAP